ncbi:MAG: outer membrane lipoprotein-sorting protein [bacterium]
MFRTLCVAFGLALISVGLAAAEAPDDDARLLVKRVIDAAPEVPYVSRMELTTPGGLVREFTMSGKHLENGIDARYIEVTGPMNLKDTRYLLYDRSERRDDQYVYIPFMKRVVRLSEKTRGEPFLGSTFFVNDMIKRRLDEFTYRFVGDETVGQRACRLVECTPKQPEGETYSKLIIAIDPIDLVVMRAQLFDHSGKLFKVHTTDTLEKIDGYWTPRQQTMRNLDDNDLSQLTTVEMTYNAPIGDDIFREAYLGR